jgi:DNA primase
MFPIHNLSGQVIAFGGRTLSNDKKQAKYLNSPESDLYHKSKVLYGISFARNEMVREDNCFLVEGYTDVISLFDSGIENVVASSGTALTTDQIKLIKRITNNVTGLYDGDFAGIKAGLRGVDMILAEGMNVRVGMFPQGEDPDSYARSHRSSEVKEFVTEQAQDFISFKTNLLSDEAQNDPIKRAGLIKEIVQSISVIPDAITRQVYVRECSSLLEMPEQTLMNELNKKLHKKFKDESYTTKKRNEPTSSPALVKQPNEENTLKSRLGFQEENLSRLLLKYGHMDFDIIRKGHDPIEVNVAAYIIDQMEMDNLQFENKVYQAIYHEFDKCLDAEEFHHHSFFINHQNKDIARFSVDHLMDKYDLSPNWMEEKNIYVKSEEADHLSMSVQKSILSYKLSVLERDIQELSLVLRDSKVDEEIENALLAISKKESQKKFLSGELGRIVLR